MTTTDDIYNVIKLDDDGARAMLDRYNIPSLEKALAVLSEPIRLSFTQRIVAKAFSIDVSSEVGRFTRLIKETIVSKEEATGRLVRSEPLEIGFFQQNLK